MMHEQDLKRIVDNTIVGGHDDIDISFKPAVLARDIGLGVAAFVLIMTLPSLIQYFIN